MMYTPFSKRCIHLYFIQAILFTAVFYLCLLHISRPPKGAIGDAVDTDSSLKEYGWKRVTGMSFDPQMFKLKVDFASEEVGSKIIAQSKSLLHVKSIQNNDRNSYLLAPCQKADWFILSFPESISIKHIAFISYEYYASTYKTIRISASPVYPTEKWHGLAEVETRIGQAEVFDISSIWDVGDSVDCWAKYLKVEFLDFHDLEENYYCSLTSMKVYGSTAVDVLESEISEENNAFSREPGTTEQLSANGEIVRPLLGGADKQTAVESPDIGNPENAGGINTMHLGNIPTLGGTESYNFTYKRHSLRSSLIWFVIRLDRKSNTNINVKIYRRLLRLMGGNGWNYDNSLSVMNRKSYLWLSDSYRYVKFWSTISKARLPIDYTWFEALILHMIRKRSIHVYEDARNDCVSNPILLCKRSTGLLGRFRCYSNFSYTSFATFKAGTTIGGYLPHYKQDLPLSGVFIFTIDGKYKKLAPLSKRVISHYINDQRFVNATRIIVAGEYVSVVELSSQTCTLVMKSFIFKDLKYCNRLMDSLLKSYVSNQNGVMFPVTWDLRMQDLLINYAIMVAKEEQSEKDETFGIVEPSPSFQNLYNNTTVPPASLDQNNNLSGEEEKGNPLKRAQGHKHVLLQLSERVKALEIVSSQLHQRINQLNEVLDAYDEKIRRIRSVHISPTSMPLLGRRGVYEDEYKELLFNACNIQRQHLIFSHKVPQSCVEDYKCIERPISFRFTSCTYFLKGYENFNSGIRNNVCPISNIKPNKRLLGCHLVVPLMRLSRYMKIFKLHKLAECCRVCGCECSTNKFEKSGFLFWMPHFSKDTSSGYGLSSMGNIPYWFVRFLRYILQHSFVALSATISIVFNIYTMSLCLLITQVFWYYRDRANRMLIYGLYEGTHRLQRSQTF